MDMLLGLFRPSDSQTGIIEFFVWDGRSSGSTQVLFGYIGLGRMASCKELILCMLLEARLAALSKPMEQSSSGDHSGPSGISYTSAEMVAVARQHSAWGLFRLPHVRSF